MLTMKNQAELIQSELEERWEPLIEFHKKNHFLRDEYKFGPVRGLLSPL